MTTAVALGEVVDVLSGFAFKSDRFAESGDLPVVRIRDVVRGSSQTFYTGDYDEKFVVRDGDLLIGMDGEFNRERWKGGKALLNQRVCRITPTDDKLDEGYLYHFLPAALLEIERSTPFVTVKHLSAKQIKGIEIPLPSIGEQRRIAAVLDAADALRTKRRQALAKLDTLTQAIFIDMFGDGRDWSASASGCSLGELEDSGAVELGRGKVISKIDIAADPGDYPIYSSAALNNGEFGRYGKYMFDEEMVTWSVDGGGHFFYRPPHKFSVTNVGGWMRVTDPKRLHARYLHAALAMLHSRLSFDWTQKAHSSVIKRVYTDIHVPDLAAQAEYARRIDALEVLRRRAGQNLVTFDELFASLQQRAFRGEL